MNDWISRKDAINIIQSWLDSDTGYSDGERNVMGCAIEELKNLPPAKCLANDRYAEGLRDGAIIERKVTERWISVKDRLPEDGTWNMFTDGKQISVERFKLDAINHFFPEGRWFSFDEAVAWMPLPQPYKEESEDKG